MNKIYITPHTHYDAVWVFNKEDYFYINIDFILKEAVELIEKHGYRFMIEQTYLLEEIERRNPCLFEKITKLIKQGKIEIADGEYLMADTMLPHGETLVREILFGKRYVKEKFGKDVPVMWQADSFGLNAQLPQIYKKSGYKYLTFRRGAKKDNPSEFWWEALDGTRILTHWMPMGYRAGLVLDKLEESFQKLKKLAATEHIFMPSGSGSVMPQVETMKAIKDWNKTHKDSKMEIATPIKFFEGLNQNTKNLETQKGEFYSGKFSYVFPNVTSSRMWIKQGLRKYENYILNSEKWSTISWLLGNYYPRKELNECWTKILFTGFHDVIPGTGIDETYDEVKEGFTFLDTHLSNIKNQSQSTIYENLKEDFVVFNPLSWNVKNWVEIKMQFDKGKVKKIRGIKSGSKEYEIEILEFIKYEDDSLQNIKFGFIADVPSLGYKTYKILEKLPKTSPKKEFKTKGNIIENQFFKIKIEQTTGLIDVFKDKHWIAKGNELVLENETGGLYYHHQNLEEPLKTEGGEGVRYGCFEIKNFETKKSPLRRVITLKEDYYSLRWPYRMLEKMKPVLLRQKCISIVKKIIIYRDLPRIDFITKIDNKHPEIRIRVKFSTDINSPTYNCESQYGAIERPVNEYYADSKDHMEKPSGIYPSQNWIDYSNEKKGLTIMNQGIPSNEIRDNDIYLTLLRSVLMVSADGIAGPSIPVPDAAELKKYTFNYSIFPHFNDWKKANSHKAGTEYNNELRALQLPNKKSSESIKTKSTSEFSFLKIKPDNLVLTSMKKTEDSDKIILRFFEAKGEETNGEIILFKEPKQVKSADLLEKTNSEYKDRIKWNNGKIIKIAVKPFEIITLKIKF